MNMLFHDRQDAGQQLANTLENYAKQPNTIVLALPRGGVPVGYEIAHALKLPLDVFLVRKLGVPGQEELAMGAIAPNDIEILNKDIVQQLHLPREAIDDVKKKEQVVLKERSRLYRGNREPLKVKDQTIILVDDGIATGATIRAAITALRHMGCKRLIIAVPVAPESTCQELINEVDELVCLQMPEPFYAIGNWYDDFSQTTDKEVQKLLRRVL